MSLVNVITNVNTFYLVCEPQKPYIERHFDHSVILELFCYTMNFGKTCRNIVKYNMIFI